MKASSGSGLWPTVMSRFSMWASFGPLRACPAACYAPPLSYLYKVIPDPRHALPTPGKHMAKKKNRSSKDAPPEIPLIGDVDEWEADVVKELLEMPHGDQCVFYIDSAGGSVYCALAVVSLM